MVLLTMTPAVVAAVNIYNSQSHDNAREAQDSEPTLDQPAVGNPISHGQLIDISKHLRENTDKVRNAEHGDDPVPAHLSDLLKGCAIYIPPPPPKPEKSDEYKALMARLRKEEEAQSYTRMLNSPATTTPSHATISQRFPNPSMGSLFPPLPQSTPEEDEMTYSDINRQLTMIANVLISVLACSVCVWKAAWHWDVPERLALSMVSSIVVALAEVAIYAGYLGRLQEARGKERSKVEVKTVEESWVIEGSKGLRDGKGEKVQRIDGLGGGGLPDGVRMRGVKKTKA